jgi:hypothetical protein
MSALQRYLDWRQERYIRRLGERCKLACLLGDRPLARLFWGLMVGAIQRRSTGQVARMERRWRTQ